MQWVSAHETALYYATYVRTRTQRERAARRGRRGEAGRGAVRCTGTVEGGGGGGGAGAAPGAGMRDR